MCEFDRSANRTPRFTVRALEESETDAALRLVWNVFVEFEAPDYGREGVDEFQKCLNDAGFLAGIRYYGAFCEENLIGVLGVREQEAHVCFLFVDGAYHRRGVGTALFQRLRQDRPESKITVNSSPYGLPFYQALGFTAAGGEQTVNGIRFTPMFYEKEGA